MTAARSPVAIRVVADNPKLFAGPSLEGQNYKPIRRALTILRYDGLRSTLIALSQTSCWLLRATSLLGQITQNPRERAQLISYLRLYQSDPLRSEET
jgi:hypothetical protein